MKRTNKQYAQALYDVTVGLSDTDIKIVISNFVTVLAKDHATGKTGAIITEFTMIARRATGSTDIAICSAHELGNATIQRISTSFGQQVESTHTIDESLIGGMTVQTDDTIFDASIKTQLVHLRQSIT